MVETSNNLKTLNRYACGQIAEEMFVACSPIQRSLLRTLIVCRHNGVSPVQIMSGFANEFKNRTGQDIWSFATALGDGNDLVDALDANGELLPPICRVGLRTAKEAGHLDLLEYALIERLAESKSPVPGESTLGAVARLMFRAFFVFWILGFILSKIVPEFFMMFEEFGIELPVVFNTLLYLADIAVTLSPIFALFVIVAMFFLGKHLISAMFRWLTSSWNLPRVSAGVNSKRILALVTQIGQAIPASVKKLASVYSHEKWVKRFTSANKRINNGNAQWNALVKARVIKRKEVRPLAMCNLSETQAWLLRRGALSQGNYEETRGIVIVKLMLSCLHIILAAVVLMTALSIFMALISIMNGLAANI